MLKDKTNPMKLIQYVFSDLIKASKFWFIIDLLVNLSISLFSLTTTIMFQVVFDSVDGFLSGNNTLRVVILSTFFLGIFLIIKNLANVLCSYTGTGALAQKANGLIRSKIHKKMKNLKAEDFENTDILDFLNKVKEGAIKGYGIYGAISTTFTFFLPYILFMTIYLFSLLPTLAFIVVIVFIVQFLAQFVRYHFSNDMESKVAPIRRKMEEYQLYLYDRRYYKDTILNDAFPMLLEKYTCAMSDYNKNIVQYEKKSLILGFTLKLITLVGYGGIFYILYYSLNNNLITIGGFAAVFSSLNVLFGMINGLIQYPLRRLSESLAIARNYYTFMNLPEEEEGTIESNEKTNIELSDISFRYPNSNDSVLKNINMSINSGEVIALVGPNGSGKSTLAKILTGLYHPTEGDVLINGVNVKDIKKKVLFKNISSVFQNYQRYNLSFCENIQISEFESDKDIKHIIELMAIDTKRKHLCFDTILSKEFDGVDLSGGEWQRIAIARALYKEHTMIILDEPTASIDPIEETGIYENFTKISKEKTTILITHRLGSTKLADRIFVLLNGELIEQGSHDELMALNGFYSDMFVDQAKWYK